MPKTKTPLTTARQLSDLRVYSQDAALLLQAQRCIEATSSILGGSRNIILGILQKEVVRKREQVTKLHLAIEQALENGGAQ